MFSVGCEYAYAFKLDGYSTPGIKSVQVATVQDEYLLDWGTIWSMDSINTIVE